MQIRRTAVVILCASLGFAACGGDDDVAVDSPAADSPAADSAAGDSASGSPYASAIAAEILTESDGMTSDPAEAKCMGENVVAAIGEDRLAELGMSPTDAGDIEDYDFTEAEFAAMFSGMFKCLDVKAGLAENLVGSGLTEEQANCIVGELTIEQLESMGVASASGNEAAVAAAEGVMRAAGVTCGVDI